jgi:hypothetical protein
MLLIHSLGAILIGEPRHVNEMAAIDFFIHGFDYAAGQVV